MRTIGRVFVTSEDVAVDAQVELARAGERAGLEGVWVHGPAANPHGDSYATTAAAAVASVTEYLRVGVLLRLSAPEDGLRLAEDVGMLDHCSSGRAELCLDGLPDAAVERLLTNLRACRVEDRWVAVTPGPLQPAVPAVLVGRASSVAGVGQVVELADPPHGAVPPDGSRPAAVGRIVLRAGPAETAAVVAAVSDPASLGAAVERLRSAVNARGALDLVFTVPSGPADEAAGVVDVLATVIAPLLRANDDEVPDMVADTLKFRSARAAFDDAPALPV